MMLKPESINPSLLYRDLTYQIIGAAIEVHKQLGPGFLETVYEHALIHEFELQQIPFIRQAKLAVLYKDICVGEYYADLLVDHKVVIELKAISALTTADEKQILHYLKATGYKVGLLINFGTSSLQHKRFIV